MKIFFLRCLTIIIVMVTASAASAQMLEGTIIDSEYKTTIPAVSIINKTRSIIAYSDSNGYYKIWVTTGDSVLFTHTAYKPVTEIIPYSMGKQYRTILMSPKIYGLKPATIVGKTKYQQDSAYKRETFTHAMNEPITHFSPVFNPVSFAVDKILGISKRAKKFKKEFADNEQTSFIDSRYTPELVSSLTGLKDDSLALFMNSYPMEYQFARQASDLEMKIWIRDNYKQYRHSLHDSLKQSKLNKD